MWIRSDYWTRQGFIFSMPLHMTKTNGGEQQSWTENRAIRWRYTGLSIRGVTMTRFHYRATYDSMSGDYIGRDFVWYDPTAPFCAYNNGTVAAVDLRTLSIRILPSLFMTNLVLYSPSIRRPYLETVLPSAIKARASQRSFVLCHFAPVQLDFYRSTLSSFPPQRFADERNGDKITLGASTRRIWECRYASDSLKCRWTVSAKHSRSLILRIRRVSQAYSVERQWLWLS